MDGKSGISQGQLRKIWAAAQELRWDEQTLHEELERVIGVVSLRQLTMEHAKLFIDYLVSEGASPSRSRTQGAGRGSARPDNLIPLASPAQRDYLAALLKALRQREDSPYYLAILKRAIGRTRIRTMDEASRIIGILRKLVDRYQGEAPGNLGRTGTPRAK